MGGPRSQDGETNRANSIFQAKVAALFVKRTEECADRWGSAVLQLPIAAWKPPKAWWLRITTIFLFLLLNPQFVRTRQEGSPVPHDMGWGTG